jgi:hypothetical protein
MSDWERAVDQAGRPVFINRKAGLCAYPQPIALPVGWEERVGDDGRKFFIDHNNKVKRNLVQIPPNVLEN